jgi:predicted HTH domain antitoxin
MGTIKATIDLPVTFPLLVKKDEADIALFIKQTVAIELYREGKISLGKASELAGARNKWEMVMLLGEHDVPIHYTAKDVKSDLKTLKKFLGK